MLFDLHLFLRWILAAAVIAGVLAGSRPVLQRPLSLAWTALLDIQWLVGAVVWWMAANRGSGGQTRPVLHAVIMTLAVIAAHILSRKARTGGGTLRVYLVPGVLLAAGHLVFL